jgi:hypothetical protein
MECAVILRKPSLRRNPRRGTARPSGRRGGLRDNRLGNSVPSIAERFAALRVPLHDGPPSPPSDWPERQDRLLQAQDAHERAFLAFAGWLREYVRRTAA